LRIWGLILVIWIWLHLKVRCSRPFRIESLVISCMLELVFFIKDFIILESLHVIFKLLLWTLVCLINLIDLILKGLIKLF
jgi:hypothetical protein